VIGVVLAAAAPGQDSTGLDRLGQRVTPRPDEICFLCNEPLHKGDVVYQIDGQRMPVHLGACDDELRAEPDRWLVKLKARGAFLSAPADRQRLAKLWFYAGLYILAGLAFAALSAHRALHSGRRPAVWFAVGLVLNVLAYVWLLTRPRGTGLEPTGVPSGLRKVATTWEPQPCPACGHANHPSAQQCLGCGARLEPKFASETSRC